MDGTTRQISENKSATKMRFIDNMPLQMKSVDRRWWCGGTDAIKTLNLS